VIYLDAWVLLKFIKREKETDALYAWRETLPTGTELITSQLARLEITRTLLRAGLDHRRVPYIAAQALKGVYEMDVTSTVLARAMAYGIPKLGSLDAIHLASADPFRTELAEFVTYDRELSAAAEHLGLPINAPS